MPLTGLSLGTGSTPVFFGSTIGYAYLVIIDRTFIDAHGTCWIIDYKTSRHEGPDREAFLDQEQQRYAGQLNRYARLMQQLGNRTIKLGLYFPLLQGWREWDY